jgi:hypothetical protein
VLSRFKASERPMIDEAIATAAQAVTVWCKSGIEACMNRFNADVQSEKGKGKKEKLKKPEGDESPPDA